MGFFFNYYFLPQNFVEKNMFVDLKDAKMHNLVLQFSAINLCPNLCFIGKYNFCLLGKNIAPPPTIKVKWSFL
jgi:hypothetical protein